MCSATIKYVKYFDNCPRCGGYVSLGDSYHIPFRYSTGHCERCGLRYNVDWFSKLLYKLFNRKERKEWAEVRKKEYTRDDLKEDIVCYALLIVLGILVLPFAVLACIFGER